MNDPFPQIVVEITCKKIKIGADIHGSWLMHDFDPSPPEYRYLL